MLTFLIVTLLIWSVQGSDLNTNTRIVGGTNAPEGRVPYQISLRDSRMNHRCGGSILNSRWVMTAGHCVGSNDDPSTYRIAAGSDYLTRVGDVYNVKRFVIHPDYSRTPLAHDIALLEVTEEIKFKDRVRPIALPTKDTKAGANVMITGWGFFEPNEAVLADRLQTLNATASSVEECRTRNRNAREFELCTVANPGRGVCMGDSGGPLVEGNAVVGIASYLLNACAWGYDSFTRVFYYKDWIVKTIS